jgi:glycosidase
MDWFSGGQLLQYDRANPNVNCWRDIANGCWNAVDGLRIDTVKHVQQSFWPGYNFAAGVYCVGEVFDGDPTYTCPYQNYLDGLLNYPT